MSIEIYSKAEVIKKADKYYYFLKYHSANDCICGGQVIVDGNFRNKYIKRNSRAGSWSIKAIGNAFTHRDAIISKTYWNAPTCAVYGQICFGNKKNIALYWAKKKAKNYDDYTDEQKYNIDEAIKWAENKGADYVINLENIQDAKRFKAVHTYCGDTPITLENNSITHKGIIYWNLDNL